MVMATCVATDIKDQVVGKRLSPPAFDNSNYIKNQRGVPDLPRQFWSRLIEYKYLTKPFKDGFPFEQFRVQYIVTRVENMRWIAAGFQQTLPSIESVFSII